MDKNTWPVGIRKSLDQNEHKRWNVRIYPGTRQICNKCEEPTGKCEEDSVFDEVGNPICEECYEANNLA